MSSLDELDEALDPDFMELCGIEDLEGLDFGSEEEQDPGGIAAMTEVAIQMVAANSGATVASVSSGSASTAHCGAARFSLPRTDIAAIGSASPMPLVTARPAEGKHCSACMVSALVPSPLCPGPFRQGDYPDWSSNWDKSCASMSRIRFAVAHGSLAGVLEWLGKDTEDDQSNHIFFNKRVLAYYSLKCEPLVMRVSFHALEARVGVLETLTTWSRHGIGIPRVLNMGPKVIVDLKEAEASMGNPLLHWA